MPRDLTCDCALRAAVHDLHVQLLTRALADGSWPGADAVELLDSFFQRVGLLSCEGCGSGPDADCHPDCLSFPAEHGPTEGAPPCEPRRG